MSRTPDTIERRITVDYGRRYVYLTMVDQNGKLLAEYEETFRQPFDLDRKDAHDEASDCWHSIYDWLNEIIVFPLPDPRDDKSDSE